MANAVRRVPDPFSTKTFPQLVHACALAYGNDIAVQLSTASQADEKLTFADLERRSATLARGLLARGVGKGSRVGFIFGNGPSFAVVLAAIARVGAVAIPISTLIRSEEMVRVLRQSDLGGLIIQRSLLGHDLVERLCEALPELASCGPDLRIARTPYLRWIVSSGEGLPRSMRDMAWLEDSGATVDEELLLEVEGEVKATDQMIEIYTSGSMALPKGVKHNHGPVLRRVHYMAHMVERQRGSTSVIPLPMFWVGGLGLCFLVNLISGVTSLCTEGTSTNSRAARGSVFTADELKARAQAKPYWSLGMTETFGPYAYADELRVPGQPLAPPIEHLADGFEVRVAGEGNRPVADGEVGEIQVRGYAVTPGLHKIERDEHFTVDGFYRTGDLGLVEGRRIHFQGRDGDMIKTAKANVSPAEVEMELQQVEGVQAAFVVGLPDDERGQIVAAALVASSGAQLDFQDIEASLRRRMSGYKVPRAYASFLPEEVPMLASNKIARRELMESLARKLGRGA